MRTSHRFMVTAAAALVFSSWAGEIIIAPSQDESDATAANAVSQAQRARAFRKERGDRRDKQPSTIIVLPGDEDEGMLAPGRNTADNAAVEARRHAAEMRKPEAARENVIVTPLLPAMEPETNAERAHENRIKARAYSKQRGDRPLGVGKDGIPYVDCSDAGSVAGRIGDDTRSGNTVTIIRDNRVIKARCL